MRRPLLTAAVAPLVFVLAACGGGGGHAGGGGGATGTGTETQAQTRTILGKQVSFHGRETVEGSHPVEMEMDNFYFEPTVLEGSPGEHITIELHNEGDAPHTFTIAKQHIDKVVQPGQNAEATVKFPKSGTMLFRCRFHAKTGMLGAVTVKSGPVASTAPTGGSGGSGGY